MPTTPRPQHLWHILRRRQASSHAPSSIKPRAAGPSAGRPRPAQVRATVQPKQGPVKIAETGPETPRRRPSLFERWLPKNERTRNYAFRFVLACPIIFLAALHSPYEIMWVNGPSMSPILNSSHLPDEERPPHDNILVQKGLLYNPNRKRLRQRGEEVPEELFPVFQRGQIVTFRAPCNPERIALKRVVAIPGDRVQPMQNSPGGEEPVVVPWNHLWVEGDVDTWEKSLDSNWYGPISQNLVIGEVKAVLSPWYKPRWIDWREHTWPAQDQGRVEENVVREATEDPKVVDRDHMWTDGRNDKRLRAIQANTEALIEKWFKDKTTREQLRDFYRNAALVVAGSDPDSEKHELATEVVSELEDIFGRQVLREGWLRKEDAKAQRLELSQSGAQSQRSDTDAALKAEKSLRAEGWVIERNGTGQVKTRNT